MPLAFACILLAALAATSAEPARVTAGGSTGPPPELIRQARESLEGGDPVAAIALVDQALRLAPEAAEGFVLLGRAYRALGRHAEATVALRRAVELLGETSPAGQDAMCDLAAALGDGQKNEEAIATLSRVIALAPRRTGPHGDLGMIYLAIGRLQAAVEEFRREIALHPAAPAAGKPQSQALATAYEGLGIAAYRTGDDALALEALARAPATADARYHAGLALLRSGRNAEAAQALRDVLRQDADHRGALQNLARATGALGLEDERRRCLDRFQELYRKQEEMASLRLRVHDLRTQADERVKAGDLPRAVLAMEQASALAPNDVEVLLDLGRLCARAGDKARAESVIRRALEKDPHLAAAHFHLGRILGERADLPGAVAALEQAVRLEPMSLQYHAAMGQIYMRLKRADDAVREMRLARRLDPADPAGPYNLGLGLAQAGAMAEAAAELQEAVRMGFTDPTVHQALAQVYRAMGDHERGAKEQQLFESLMRAQGTRP